MGFPPPPRRSPSRPSPTPSPSNSVPIDLARVITPENRAEVLPRFFHVSREEAKEVAAEIRPVENPPQRVVVTALPAPVAPAGTLALAAPRSPVTVGSTVEPPRANSERFVGASAPRAEVQPLDPERSRLHITVTRQLRAAGRDAERGTTALALPLDDR